MTGKRIWMGAGLLAIVGAIALLVAGGLSQNMVYFLTPAELEARSAEMVDAPVRLGGQVKPGSVEWSAERREGSYARSGRFHSTAVMVKHSNEYAPPEDGAHPKEAYRTLIEDGGP